MPRGFDGHSSGTESKKYKLARNVGGAWGALRGAWKVVDDQGADARRVMSD